MVGRLRPPPPAAIAPPWTARSASALLLLGEVLLDDGEDGAGDAAGAVDVARGEHALGLGEEKLVVEQAALDGGGEGAEIDGVGVVAEHEQRSRDVEVA